MTTIRRNIPRHGHVFSPESRAVFAYLNGDLVENDQNSLEAGKFFPATEGNLTDPIAPTDIKNNPPPADGQIASAGWPYARLLDEPGTHWRKHKVRAGQPLTVSWNYSAAHVTRRWVYFMTKRGWDPQQKLTRASFEDKPFFTVELRAQPYWEHTDALWPPSPTVHDVVLPNREGYHVMLAIWEVANTGAAFYQVIDLDFEASGGGGERPNPPSQVQAEVVASTAADLTWSAATGGQPIAYYTVHRDGSVLARVDAPFRNYHDGSLAADTEYTYFISATDVDGNQSLPSHTVVIRTPGSGEDIPPTPPRDLHSMETTASSVHLMWGGSSGSAGIKNYLVYRNGRQIGTTEPSRLEYTDSGLAANTEYRYFVAALDNQGRLSVPSNVLTVKTRGDGGAIPEWAPNVPYEVGDKVTYSGRTYQCLQAHPSNSGWTPVDTINILWKEVAVRR
ncbi:chitin-binding protein [Bordetella genomosp. 9]|uniref:Chitin-binding protein n=2 Tax=Bordetella genomosp. 9 TaxID=1416803 RepID=A0A1W6Z540_9BORD|nr:chitin-binding protein [Bordetella genomosp. 9]